MSADPVGGHTIFRETEMKNTGNNPFGALVRAFGRGYMSLDDMLFGGHLPGGAMTDNQVRSSKEKKASGLFGEKPEMERDAVSSKMPLDMEPEEAAGSSAPRTLPAARLSGEEIAAAAQAHNLPLDNNTLNGIVDGVNGGLSLNASAARMAADHMVAPRQRPAGGGLVGGDVGGAPSLPMQPPPISPELHGNPNPFPSPQPAPPPQPAQPVLAPQMTPPVAPGLPMSMPPGAGMPDQFRSPEGQMMGGPGIPNPNPMMRNEPVYGDAAIAPAQATQQSVLPYGSQPGQPVTPEEYQRLMMLQARGLR